MATREPSAERRALLLRAYHADDAQDLDRLVAFVSDDVDRPDDRGSRLHGRGALVACWTEQWTRVRVHDQPVALRHLDDGRVAAHVLVFVDRLLADGSACAVVGALVCAYRVHTVRCAFRRIA